MKSDYWRQRDFYKPERNDRVCIIGDGSIGSYEAFALARMGVKHITVVDFDKVENHNLPNQFFAEGSLPEAEGSILKTHATVQTLTNHMPDTMKNVDFKIFSQDIRDCFDEVFDRRYDAVFIAVDNMDIRKWIWTKLRANLGLCKYLIDVRIGGLYINVFSIKIDNASAIRVYEDELWIDKEVKELPCTGTAIIDVTLTAVGEAVGRFRQAMNNDLRAIWTFHACDFGGSAVFAHYHIKEDEKDKTDDFVRGVGKEITPEKES